MTITEFLLARIAEDEAVARSFHYDWSSSQEALRRQFVAECEAKRRIVELHAQRDDAPACSECGGFTSTTGARGIEHAGYLAPWPCPTLRALASVYADHQEFQGAWRPATTA
jgi:hypothetical protein